MKRSQKAGFVAREALKSQKRRKRKREREKARRRKGGEEKKAMVALFMAKKKKKNLLDAKGQVYLAVVFSNSPARYIFQYFYFILINLFYFG